MAFDGIISNDAAEWVDIPNIGTATPLLGGANGDGWLNGQAVALMKRQNLLRKLSEGFDNRADLQSFLNLLPIGTRVFTKGCNDPGDNGGSVFKVIAASGTPDDYSRIRSGDGTKDALLRPTNNELFPEQFGAAGVDFADDTAAIQRMINCTLCNKMRLEGEYGVSDIIALRSNLRLYGSGTIKGLPLPAYRGFSHHALMHSIGKTNIRVRELSFDITDWTDLTASIMSYRCIIFRQVSTNFRVERCDFKTTGGAVAVIGCKNYRIKDNTSECYGDHADGVFDNWGEWNQGPQEFSIVGNKVYGNSVARWGVLINGEVFETQLMNPKNFFVDRNEIYNCSLDSIWVGGRKPTASNFTICNNILDGARKAVSLSDCDTCLVHDNVISNITTHTIEGWREGTESTTPARAGEIGLRNSKIYNNTLRNVASIGTGQPSAIWLRSNSEGNTIKDNKILGSTHYWGITTSESAINNIIKDNEVAVGRSSQYSIINANNKVDGTGYSPTLTHTGNVASSAALQFVYTFGARTTTVTFRVQVTPTASATFTELRMSLPHAATVSADSLQGCAFALNGAGAALSGDSSGVARLTFTSVSTAVHTFSGQFTYRT